jgi:hypothetical protein
MTPADDLIQVHVEALLDRRLDDVLADYADDAVLRTEGHVCTGRDAIRDHLEQAIAAGPASFHMDFTTVATGERVRMDWVVLDAPGGTRLMSGRDDFVVREGRIREQDVVVDA